MTRDEARSLLQDTLAAQQAATPTGDRRFDGETLRVYARNRWDPPGQHLVGCDHCEEGIHVPEDKTGLPDFIRQHKRCRFPTVVDA